MSKTKQTEGGQQGASADPCAQIRMIPKFKKERPASKGRVHKGRTRDRSGSGGP
jgi:hypothetical protein